MIGGYQGGRNVLLVENANHRTLIDIGAGRDYAGNPGHLSILGVEVAFIQIAVRSHADFDHIGGAVDGNRPTFGNAEHYLLRGEAEFWRWCPGQCACTPLRRSGSDIGTDKYSVPGCDSLAWLNRGSPAAG